MTEQVLNKEGQEESRDWWEECWQNDRLDTVGWLECLLHRSRDHSVTSDGCPPAYTRISTEVAIKPDIRTHPAGHGIGRSRSLVLASGAGIYRGRNIVEHQGEKKRDTERIEQMYDNAFQGKAR